MGPNGTESHTLDALGRLTSATIPTQGTTTYTHDATGNRLTKVNGGNTTTYTYDDADQLTLEGTTSYTYDNAGNLTARGTSTYSYDWRGRMTASTTGGTTTSYTYDGTDVRVKKQTGAATTTYLWDRESGLPLLIDDGTNGYVHQGTGNPLTQTTLAGGTPKWLLTDALGSVRGAADAAGTLTGSANYDTFGAPYGTDSTGSKFGFTGEQRDPETGFEYLRARYYNPSNGRFTSRDSLFPAGEGTQGYNRYAYAGNNPTTATDPSGHLTSPQETIVKMIFAARTVVAACERTVYCAILFNSGLGLAALGFLPNIGITANSVTGWTGMFISTMALLICGMDYVIIEGSGPPGLHIRGGDHCFEMFRQTDGTIPDCTFKVAAACFKFGGRHTGQSCVDIPLPLRLRLSLCNVPGQEPPGGGSGCTAPGTITLATNGNDPPCKRQQEEPERTCPPVDTANDTGPVVFRFGTEYESAEKLEGQSEQAQQAGFPHGVSFNLSDEGRRPPRNASAVHISTLERYGFHVHHTPTRNNPNHRTVELPHPVTKEIADTFNCLLGRSLAP